MHDISSNAIKTSRRKLNFNLIPFSKLHSQGTLISRLIEGAYIPSYFSWKWILCCACFYLFQSWPHIYYKYVGNPNSTCVFTCFNLPVNSKQTRERKPNRSYSWINLISHGKSHPKSVMNPLLLCSHVLQSIIYDENWKSSENIYT